MYLTSPALEDGLFTTRTTREIQKQDKFVKKKKSNSPSLYVLRELVIWRQKEKLLGQIHLGNS